MELVAYHIYYLEEIFAKKCRDDMIAMMSEISKIFVEQRISCLKKLA